MPFGEVSVSLDNGIFWSTGSHPFLLAAPQFIHGIGGGFAETQSRPSYQEAAVKKYLATSDGSVPPLTMFNSAGRGYPDFSTVGICARVISVSHP